MQNPNFFAFFVLAIWPIASVVLFRALPVGRALLASLILAYLFLPPPPTAFDLPLVPAMNKENLPSLIALLSCAVLYKKDLKILPDALLGRVLLGLFVFSPLATTLTNLEPIFFGEIGVTGLGVKDAIALVFNQAMLAVPFVLALSFLRRAEDHREILFALMIAGLIYSLFMLIEVRLSPQLNIWIYGFFQHNFEQMMREGGFRPIVFLYHALWVAFFAMTAVVSAVILMRRDGEGRTLWYGGAALYLGGVLYLCKSLASVLYAGLLVPAAVFLPIKMQIRIALVCGLLAVSYPVLKGYEILPEKAITALAGRISTERANSLQFRLDNEQVLVDRAFEKPVFGWGSWGRNLILDPVSGITQAVPDGRWVIVIGVFGWVGYLAEYGLLALSLFMLWRVSRHQPRAELSPYVAGVALLLGANMVDMLPNATLTPLTFLWAGAIMGYVERHPKKIDKLTSVL